MTTTANTLNNKTSALDFGPDGRLYYARKNGTIGLSIFDLAAPAEVERHATSTISALIFSSDGGSYYTWNQSVLTHFDIATDTEIPFAVDGANTANFGQTGLGHMGLITPL